MTLLSDEANYAFYHEYSSALSYYEAYASAVADHLRERLQDAGVGVHAVFARAKDPKGLLEKIQRKGYDSPKDDVTDLVGARIITNYSDEVDKVAQLVREFLIDVDESRSVDKRSVLTGKEFGYRSVHVIGTLPAEVLAIKGISAESSLMFEVQVRSILEHAWAQIDHEIVYKGGIDYPEDFVRRFHAIAGTLEILDREFIQLREFKRQIIDSYKEKFSNLTDLDLEFDAARLIALLEVARPHGPGWYDSKGRNPNFAPHSENSCVSALKAAELANPQRLVDWLSNEKLKAAVERFAANAGISPTECSHYALCLLAAATVAPSVTTRFPDLYGYELMAALQEDEDSEGDV